MAVFGMGGKSNRARGLYAATVAMVAGLASIGTGSAGQAQDGQPSSATFDQKCATCHQSSGQGITGVFPKLAGNPTVTGNATNIVRLVLNGRGQMPGFKSQLDDRTIAAVVTHIRNSWGNHAAPVTEAEVKAVRGGMSLGR